MKDIINKLDNILNEGHLGQMADRVELDHEVQMARADLYKLAKYSIKLHEMLKNVSELNGIDGWQASKITKAADYIGSVYHSMDAETTDAEQEMDALADVIMPAEHDDRVCMDCADTIHHPTDTGCPYDGHDENGKNWMDPMGMSEDISELSRLSGIAKEGTTQGTTRTDGTTNSKNKTEPDIGMTADTTPVQEPGAEEEAQKELDKMTPNQKKKALGMTTKNESKFSDWGKK
jgi:hypothetical protein